MHCQVHELSELSIRAAQWIEYKWNAKYSKGQSKQRLFVPRFRARSLGLGPAQPAWVWLNHLRTGVKRFHSCLHK